MTNYSHILSYTEILFMAECTYVQFLISFLQLVGYHSVRMSMDNPKRKIHKVYYNMGSDSERITEIVNLSESKG